MRTAYPGIAAAILVATSGFGFAHSGGLNQDGCHDNGEPYHCHRQNGEHHPFAANPTCARQWGIDASGYDTLAGPLTQVLSDQQIQICEVTLTLVQVEIAGGVYSLDSISQGVLSQFEGRMINCTIRDMPSHGRAAICRL